MVNLQEALERWRRAGLLSTDQARAISEFEARQPQGGGVTSGTGLGANEVVAYAGTVIALAGIGFLLGTQGQQLGSAGRLSVLALLTLAAFALGLLPIFRATSGPARRARASALTVAVVTVGFLTYEFLTDARILTSAPYDNGAPRGAIASLLTGALSTFFLVRTRAGLLALSMAGGLYAAVSASLAWFQVEDRRARWLLFVAAAVILVVAAEVLATHARGWAVEILRTSAVVVPIVSAFFIAGNNQLPIELIGGALAPAAFAAAVFRSSGGYAIAGGIGLFAFVLDIGFRYFKDSLGFPVILIFSGVVLLAIGFALSKLLPRLAPETSSA